MALAFGTSPTKVFGTTNLTTGSITPAAGSLLVACHIWNEPGAQTALDTISDSTTRTWTRQVLKSINTGSTGGTGKDGGTAIWTATANGSAMTVTAVNGTGTATGHEHMLFVYVLTDTGTPIPGVVGAASGGPVAGTFPSVPLSGMAVGSYVVACSSDWSAVGPAATSYTPGTGQTVGAQDWVSAQYGGAIWRTTSTLAGTTQTMNLTAPDSETFNIVALEIKANSAVGSTARPGLPNRRFWRAAHRSANI